ncbi:MAG: tetratricopeptide repeat protein [Spirosoma sp.]|nr:tetratricopeptide repeat protein [Spirosoma sp.]
MRRINLDFLTRNRGLSVVFLCLLVSVGPLNAQDFAWTPGLQHAYTDLQKGRVTPARQTLIRELAKNGIRLFVDDYADMLLLVTTDDDKLFARLSHREAERIDALELLDDASPWQRLLLAEVRLHWAFIKLKFGKETSASWDVIRAYRLLTENQKLFPDFLPTYKSLGTLHVLIGSVPDSYAWVAKLLGLRGNIGQGQREIKQAQQDAIFGLEARLIDLLVRAYVVQFTDSDERVLRQLMRDNPDNLLLHFFAATTEQKQGRSEQALAYLSSRPTSSDYLPMPVIDNILGDIYLQKGQYATATAHFRRFLSQYKGRNFLKDTRYKLFLCYWLADRSADLSDAEGRAMLEQVTRVGRTSVESDKAAQRFAEAYLKRRASVSQKVLMRARLATDGGFTDSALTYLQPYTETRFATLTERAEYNYRLGRIYQRRNDPDVAIPYLSRALDLTDTPDGRQQELSFGASAALQLGYIYQQKNDRARARSFFQKALTFRRHEYKNSIDNKARAALSQL